MPNRANRVRENQDGQEEQEAVEEGEKDGSNEAAVASGVLTDNPQPRVGVVCDEMSAPSRGCGTRAKDFRVKEMRMREEAAAEDAAASFFVSRGYY